MTGCSYGFGGKRDWLKNHALCVGYHAVAAIADTIGAAWAVAHFAERKSAATHGLSVGWVEELKATKAHHAHGGPSSLSAPRPTLQASPRNLASLPIESLRLPLTTVQLLHEFNIRRIEQLLVLPRADLPSRFGPELLLRLDQALGVVPELLKPERLAEPIEESWPFEPPIANRRHIETALAHLLEKVLNDCGRGKSGAPPVILVATGARQFHFAVGCGPAIHNAI